MKISENRACQLKQVAASISENQRLRESMETLEKMLTKTQADREKLQARTVTPLVLRACLAPKFRTKKD